MSGVRGGNVYLDEGKSLSHQAMFIWQCIAEKKSETSRDRRDASTGREIRGVIDSFDTKWIYVKIRWHDFTTFHWPFRYVKHTVYGNEPGHSIRRKISKSAKWTYVVFIGQRRYDAFLKIIILCIWCNRICWHALMFKKHIIFQILYIIVGPLCPASLKRIVLYKVPPSDKRSLLWLANWPSALWLAEHRKHSSEM